MSEQLNTHNPEDSYEEVDETAEQSHESQPAETEQSHHEIQVETPEISKTAETTENIREDITEPASQESEDLKRAFQVEDEAEPLPPPNKAVKENALNLNLTIARSKLNKPGKAFSRFIHRPVVNSLSEVTGKTLIRPSAILCGGVFTVLGSLYYLYATQKTGYKYNFLVALLLFAGGFVVGLVLEMLYRIVSKRSSH